MRYLHKSKASYIGEPLATYRYHAESGTMKQEFRLIRESFVVLQTFNYFIPDFKKKYDRIIKALNKRNNICRAFKLAKVELIGGDQHRSHQTIKPYKFSNIKIFVFYLMTCIPSRAARFFLLFALKIKNMIKIEL
jgi:hypothetical protein